MVCVKHLDCFDITSRSFTPCGCCLILHKVKDILSRRLHRKHSLVFEIWLNIKDTNTENGWFVDKQAGWEVRPTAQPNCLRVF